MPGKPKFAAKLSAAIPRQLAKRRDWVRALLVDNARSLDEIPKQRLRALAPVLEQAKAELKRDLAAWLRDAPNGRERFTAQHLRNALANVNRGIQRLHNFHDIRVGMQTQLEQGGRAAGEMSIRHLERELNLFATVFDGAVYPVSLAEPALLASGEQALIPRFRTSAARYADNMAIDIRRQLAVGVARNETFDAMIKRMARMGGPKGQVALRGVLGEPGAYVEHISEGLFRRYRYWGERIVRTEVVNAYNVLHRDGIEAAHDDDPDYRMRWDAAVDSRVCPFCAGLDGIVVDVGDEFPGVGPNPPAHPNCRCTVVPWKDAWPDYLPLRDTNDQQPALRG